MGVPAFYRWLSTRYPKIVVDTIEEEPVDVDGVEIPVDGTKPNPNGEYDNLYLDMNGIIHPCFHPEDRPAPEGKTECFKLIFESIDRVMLMVRPRNILYMAIDGVAPRAKMNQQRGRRFRSAKDAEEKEKEEEKIRQELKQQGLKVRDKEPGVLGELSDSNVITPGTPFMANLSVALQYYIHLRLNTDPMWRNLKVILSDANVPGEGEHKIMQYIREQRGRPGWNPNTRHCIYGLDADLIMLSLATHEPHFSVLREVVFQRNFGRQDPNPSDKKKIAKKPHQFLKINVLREYLAMELNIDELPFEFDEERAIDDFVFLCFFVGNDFLPHSPTLEIREGGIDLLMKIYKSQLAYMNGYVCDGPKVNLKRVERIMKEVAKMEADILRMRMRKLQQDKDRRRNDGSYQSYRDRHSGRNQTSAAPSGGKAIERNGGSNIRRATQSAGAALQSQRPQSSTGRPEEKPCRGRSLKAQTEIVHATRTKIARAKGKEKSVGYDVILVRPRQEKPDAKQQGCSGRAQANATSLAKRKKNEAGGGKGKHDKKEGGSKESALDEKEDEKQENEQGQEPAGGNEGAEGKDQKADPIVIEARERAAVDNDGEKMEVDEAEGGLSGTQQTTDAPAKTDEGPQAMEGKEEEDKDIGLDVPEAAVEDALNGCEQDGKKKGRKKDKKRSSRVGKEKSEQVDPVSEDAMEVEPRGDTGEGPSKAKVDVAGDKDDGKAWDELASLGGIADYQSPAEQKLSKSDEHKAKLAEKTLQSRLKDKMSEKNDMFEEMVQHEESIGFGEAGWKERYYKMKYPDAGDDLPNIIKGMVQSYVEGLCWVMAYYYDGVPSWKWFYPYHYAPFATDMLQVSKITVKFKLGEPFSPIHQLMGVLPAASRHCIPKPLQHLFISPKSPILDFYPENFKCDMNGKRFAWMAVVLLPFIDEQKLLWACKPFMKELTDKEKDRNEKKHDLMFFHGSCPLSMLIHEMAHKQKDKAPDQKLKAKQPMAPEDSNGINGFLCLPNGDHCPGAITAPYSLGEDISGNSVICSIYLNAPHQAHQSKILKDTFVQTGTVTPDDVPHEVPLWHETGRAPTDLRNQRSRQEQRARIARTAAQRVMHHHLGGPHILPPAHQHSHPQKRQHQFQPMAPQNVPNKVTIRALQMIGGGGHSAQTIMPPQVPPQNVTDAAIRLTERTQGLQRSGAHPQAFAQPMYGINQQALPQMHNGNPNQQQQQYSMNAMWVHQMQQQQQQLQQMMHSQGMVPWSQGFQQVPGGGVNFTSQQQGGAGFNVQQNHHQQQQGDLRNRRSARRDPRRR